MVLERTVKGWVKTTLDGMGAYYFMPVQTGYGQRCLDFIGSHRGRAFAIETKAPGKKPRPTQKVIMRKMEAAGMAVFVIDSKESIAPLRQWLEKC